MTKIQWRVIIMKEQKEIKKENKPTPGNISFAADIIMEAMRRAAENTVCKNSLETRKSK